MIIVPNAWYKIADAKYVEGAGEAVEEATEELSLWAPSPWSGAAHIEMSCWGQPFNFIRRAVLLLLLINKWSWALII